MESRESFAGKELKDMKAEERTGTVGYMGHDPELFCDSIENNIRMGDRFYGWRMDVCRIISILVVIWFHSKGVTLILVVLLPLILAFTRHVQKNMLSAKIRNRKAVGRVSGHVPVILILNAVVVAVVMLLSVSGSPVILTFF